MFSRPNGDIEKMLSRLPRIPTSSCIERLHRATNINERDHDLTEKEKFNNTIIDFTYFAKKVIPQLKAMKKAVQNFKVQKNTAIANYKILLNFLDQYEELNLTQYTGKKTDRLVIGDPKNKELKDQMDHMVENLKNPYEEMYHWCKGEIYDLQALGDAVASKENIEKTLKKLETKKHNT